MSKPKRQMHLNVFILSTGHHEASWRHPDTRPDLVADIGYYRRLAQTAERGKLDSLFIADGLSLSSAVKHRVMSGLEPFTLLSALAAVTERIGLIATVSTTYNEPFHVARKFASLDHISSGRTGWNIVTSVGDASALNFGVSKHPEHQQRYERAREFLDVVTRLWDSWEDEALVIDKEAGIYADISRIHDVNYIGAHFSVRGPLNLPRGPQGYPVLIQAGSSEYGKELAAETAEAIFTAQNTMGEGQAFYADVKSRMGKYGRSPSELKILPGFSPIIGDTEAEAREKLAELNELAIPEFGLIRLSNLFETDMFRYPLDEPLLLEELPTVDQIKGQKARFQIYTDMVRNEKMTLRQLIIRTAAGRGHFTIAGTPIQIADEMERWIVQNASDGFNVMPPYFPGGLEEFVDKVVPELQNRGLFRTDYTGRTLRDHMGLKRPVCRENRLVFSN